MDDTLSYFLVRKLKKGLTKVKQGQNVSKNIKWSRCFDPRETFLQVLLNKLQLVQLVKILLNLRNANRLL